MFSVFPFINLTSLPVASTTDASSVKQSQNGWLYASFKSAVLNTWGVCTLRYKFLGTDLLFPFGVNSRRESVTSMTGITAPDRFASSNALSITSSETNGRTPSCTATSRYQAKYRVRFLLNENGSVLL